MKILQYREDQKEKASHGELHRVYSPSLFGVCSFRDGTFYRKVGLTRLRNTGADCPWSNNNLIGCLHSRPADFPRLYHPVDSEVAF